MDRERIERGQVWVYLVAIGAGLLLGSWAPILAAIAESLIWPALGVLLFVTFRQVPLASLRASLGNRRFLAAVLVGNFLLIPLLVWALVSLAGLPPAVMLGVLLVLLMPCTDWYLTFTHLTGGDTASGLAVTPLNLLLQLLLLPVYLWLFLGRAFADLIATGAVLTVFATLIVLPLLAAWLTDWWAARRSAVAAAQRRGGGLLIPLVALVVCLVATSQVNEVGGALPQLPRLTAVFGAFLILAVATGWLLARGLGFAAPATRAVMLSLGTRNSFVVLPLALALPPPWHAAAVVVVYQSLVELLGLAILVWLLPRITPDRVA